MPDLWPPNFGNTTVDPPLRLLREQAGHLTERTSGLIEGLVATAKDGDNFVHSFYVVVPTLDNYSYLLFAVNHPVLLYPALLVTDPAEEQLRADTPLDFRENVRKILGSERTLRIIRALLAQAGGAAGQMGGTAG